MTQFHGQVAWVVGATAGIGRAMAREFARRGADVAVSGRRQERLAEVVAEVEGLGRRALAVPCDVRRDDEVAAAVQTIVAHFGRLDVAVANAGFGVIGRVEDLTADDWQRQFETNFFGALSVVRHSLPALRRTGGRLGLVSSVSGILASPRVGAYAASKFALRAVGLTLAMELRGSGVSCTLLNPGFVSTEIGQVDNQGQFEASRQDKRPAALMWTADDAARVMVKAIAARKREYTFTAHGKLGVFLGMHFPGLMCWLQRDARSKTAKLD
ncbi:SDR family NAD(P)-dependent oxidoreductase [Nannocystis sp. ILAH1]|uniref:SDR family NAD(P)-dependent oxidoreductase n=1 Tax=unclassified Nannocystis TaxID=2627009 RepID=UPI00226F553B|nr:MULTISPECIES: SDR family NAD(P)-dependent oxidoreductase [unclassified Nannocystis]MCY0992646.1 SDR family NAD(P)-dependent oxidoreductase [Nannocystis sp. ILAH1]MCY1070124.1 SDR family NAD(P)-dependent oxidoreductase [Nannocystis sp. RBIL2]